MATTSLKSELPSKQEEEERQLSPRFRLSPWTGDIDEPVPIREIVSVLSQHVSKFKGPLLRACAAFFAAASIQSLVPMSTKFVIDYLIPSKNFVLLWITAGALVVLFLLRSAIAVLGNHVLVFTSTHIVFDLRRRLFEHLQLLHLAFYEREQSGKLVSKLINDASALQMLIQQAMPILSTSIFTIVVTFALMFMLNVKLTLLTLIVIPLYTGIGYYFRSRLYHRAMEVRERASIVAGNINEVITGIKVVKSFGMEDQEQKRFVRMIRENLDYEIDLATTNSVRSNILEFITGFARAAVIVFGGSAVIDTQMSLGDYVAFTAFMMTLFQPMLQISTLAIQSIQARTGLERIIHILDIRPQIVDRPHARVVERIEGHVKLENVTFSYQEGGMPVLHDINLEAMPGEVVALVGPSGSGKTTVVNLLTRFYDPNEGRILIDGVDLRNLQLKSYRRHVGIVPQEPFLFSGTIQDNICYGKGWATADEVEEAASQANALEFINELPEGMETQVGERGSALSGGQRQRISIARALLKDPDILILDEATSSLDTKSEQLVQQALDRLMQGRTVFVIAHRLSTIQNADKIVVLNQGRIVEIGDHETLMAKGALYASLYAQAPPPVETHEEVMDTSSYDLDDTTHFSYEWKYMR